MRTTVATPVRPDGRVARARSRRGRRSPRLMFAAGIVLTATLVVTPVSAHVTEDFTHLWTEHIKPKFATPGTINADSNPVHWTRLTGVPATIADGLDAGEVVGFGLKEYHTIYGDVIGVDHSKVQRRVTDTCSPGSSIRSINENAAVACNPGPAVFSAWRDDRVNFCAGQPCVVGKLSVPAGSYFIIAKIRGLTGDDFFGCVLLAGADSDAAQSQDYEDAHAAILTMTVVHTFADAGEAVVKCQKPHDETGWGRNLKITAVRVGTISNVHME